jgi:hypothetical protein
MKTFLDAIAPSSASVRRTRLKTIVTVAHRRIPPYELTIRSENGGKRAFFEISRLPEEIIASNELQSVQSFI